MRAATFTRVWWLSPVTAITAVSGAALLATALLPDRIFRKLWHTPKLIQADTLAMFLAAVLLMIVGALVISAGSPRRTATTTLTWPGNFGGKLIHRASLALFWMTCAGYAALITLAVVKGIGLHVLLQPPGITDLRFKIGTIPGVTTFVQFGIAAAILGTYDLIEATGRHRTLVICRLGIVFGLAVIRAYWMSERLALIELIVPVAVIAAARLAQTRARFVKIVCPAVGVVGFVAVFSVFEYFRSWKAHYQVAQGGDYWVFAAARLTGYYTTSVNNGQITLDHILSPSTRWPNDSFAAIWEFPILRTVDPHTLLSGVADPSYLALVRALAAAEMNNNCGYAQPLVDFGLVGGLFWFLAVGVIAGLLFKAFCEARPTGLTLFPVFFLGLLELPRYLYWTTGRVFPALVALGIVAYLQSREQRRRQTLPPEAVV